MHRMDSVSFCQRTHTGHSDQRQPSVTLAEIHHLDLRLLRLNINFCGACFEKLTLTLGGSLYSSTLFYRRRGNDTFIFGRMVIYVTIG